MLRTAGYTSANKAAFANADPHMHIAAEGRPTTRSSTPGSVPRTQTHRKRSSKPIFLLDGVFVSTMTIHEQSKQTYYQSAPSLTQFRFHLLKAIVSARIIRSVGHIGRTEIAYASTQQTNKNPIAGPMNGIFRSPKETMTDVKTITPRYAEVAMAVSIPV